MVCSAGFTGLAGEFYHPGVLSQSDESLECGDEGTGELEKVS